MSKNLKAYFQKVGFHHSLMWRIKKLTIFQQKVFMSKMCLDIS